MSNKKESPCLTCTSTKDPEECTNKRCQRWQNWWLARWALIHRPLEEVADSCSAPTVEATN